MHRGPAGLDADGPQELAGNRNVAVSLDGPRSVKHVHLTGYLFTKFVTCDTSWPVSPGRLPGYRGIVTSSRLAPVARPSRLDMYAGLWVATVDDEVVAAEETSHQLAIALHNMDHRKRARAVTEFVRPESDAYIVGVG